MVGFRSEYRGEKKNEKQRPQNKIKIPILDVRQAARNYKNIKIIMLRALIKIRTRNGNHTDEW